MAEVACSATLCGGVVEVTVARSGSRVGEDFLVYQPVNSCDLILALETLKEGSRFVVCTAYRC